MMVMTMVRITTSVALKVRARSRRKLESNNILRFLELRRIMDFKTLLTDAGALRGVDTDALLLVVAPGSDLAAHGKALSTALADALKCGDFAFEAGCCLQLSRLDGVKATRVVLAAAGSDSAKAFAAAVSAGLGVLKGGGSKQLVIASALREPINAAQAQALVGAVDATLYVYRHTKPSAPPASKLKRISVACTKAEAAAVRQGLLRGEAIAAGVALARECANRPGNHCTPSFLADEARRLGKEHGLDVQVLERKDIAKLGMGCFLAVAQASKEPMKFIVASYRGAAKSVAPLVLVGKPPGQRPPAPNPYTAPAAYPARQCRTRPEKKRPSSTQPRPAATARETRPQIHISSANPAVAAPWQ
jgi:leucyl aminopeptidase